MSTPSPSARPPRPQAVLTVRRREQLSAHIVRIVAGGPGFHAFQANEFTDMYAKLVFVEPALGLTPPYDLAALRQGLLPHQRPVTRTYTVRRAQSDEQQLAIDFVVHGDAGIAAPWAARAAPR
jgi:NADPH-dependent ferric siderophore reductase